MINIIFWMVMIFTTAILLYNKWLADSVRRQEYKKMIFEAMAHEQQSLNLIYETAEHKQPARLPARPAQERDCFITLPGLRSERHSIELFEIKDECPSAPLREGEAA